MEGGGGVRHGSFSWTSHIGRLDVTNNVRCETVQMPPHTAGPSCAPFVIAPLASGNTSNDPMLRGMSDGIICCLVRSTPRLYGGPGVRRCSMGAMAC